jgi:hypothetical protein
MARLPNAWRVAELVRLLESSQEAREALDLAADLRRTMQEGEPPPNCTKPIPIHPRALLPLVEAYVEHHKKVDKPLPGSTRAAKALEGENPQYRISRDKVRACYKALGAKGARGAPAHRSNSLTSSLKK